MAPKLGRDRRNRPPILEPLEPTHAQHVEPKSGPTCCNLNTLATASHQVGPNMAQQKTRLGTLLNTKHHQWWDIPVKMRVLTSSYWAGHVLHFEAMWTSNLGRSCSNYSCTMLEPSWAEVGAKRVGAGRKLEPCCPKSTHAVAMLDWNGAFGGCWAAMQNVQPATVPSPFLATSPWRKWPPLTILHLKLYQID